jgi:hypothetical protein
MSFVNTYATEIALLCLALHVFRSRIQMILHIGRAVDAVRSLRNVTQDQIFEVKWRELNRLGLWTRMRCLLRIVTCNQERRSKILVGSRRKSLLLARGSFSRGAKTGFLLAKFGCRSAWLALALALADSDSPSSRSKSSPAHHWKQKRGSGCDNTMFWELQHGFRS